MLSASKAVIGLTLAFVGFLATTSGSGASETANYTYDALGRLTTTTVVNPTNSLQAINVGQTTIVNFDAAANRTCLSTSTASSPTPTISICDAWVTEGGKLTLVVTRRGSAAGVVGVSWATTTTGTTATNGASGTTGVDYQTASGALTFAAGETSKLINITTYVDTNVTEGSESLKVTLTTPTNGAVLGDAVATGWILDNV